MRPACELSCNVSTQRLVGFDVGEHPTYASAKHAGHLHPSLLVLADPHGPHLATQPPPRRVPQPMLEDAVLALAQEVVTVSQVRERHPVLHPVLHLHSVPSAPPIPITVTAG